MADNIINSINLSRYLKYIKNQSGDFIDQIVYVNKRDNLFVSTIGIYFRPEKASYMCLKEEVISNVSKSDDLLNFILIDPEKKIYAINYPMNKRDEHLLFITVNPEYLNSLKEDLKGDAYGVFVTDSKGEIILERNNHYGISEIDISNREPYSIIGGDKNLYNIQKSKYLEVYYLTLYPKKIIDARVQTINKQQMLIIIFIVILVLIVVILNVTIIKKPVKQIMGILKHVIYS